MCSCHSILECCVTFSGVKLSIRSFVLFHSTQQLCEITSTLDVSSSYSLLFTNIQPSSLPSEDSPSFLDYG